MSKFDLKIKALKLRKSGKSILEISRLTGVSKSTTSLWCRDIKLTLIQEKRLHEKMRRGGLLGRLKGAQVNKDKKIVSQNKAVDWAKNLVPSISDHDKLIAGIALYWAEGSKAVTTTGFIFVNSDPVMIRFMYEWLVRQIKIQKQDIKVQISINKIHQYRIKEVLNFWSHLLDLSPRQFSKTFFSKSIQKKVYNNQNTHFGVLRLGVIRSTVLKYKVLSLIEILKAGVAQVVRANAS